LTDASVTFTIRQERRTSLKEYLVRGLFLPSRNPVVSVHALSQINLSCQDGDRVGIIGHNGAGKSTMLKLLAGVYPPTSGTRVVEGRICSLFDIALGFEGDANGWDNIKYRAYLQGETPRTLKSKIDGIAEFSELGEFLNVPVRYYSAGMMIRLAFSIATAIEPEVLLIDEVLSVGDLAFQQKAQKRMREMMVKARLMVVVSHDLASVEAICNRVLWMKHGSVIRDGNPKDVTLEYVESTTLPPPAHTLTGEVAGGEAHSVGGEKSPREAHTEPLRAAA
ncbi:MAG: ABC transporter ATP-binding protein, partial [Fimbriiglobus sp.]